MAILASAALQQKQETVNDIVEEAVRFGMQSGFSQPIIEAVEDATGRSISDIAEEEEEPEKSTRKKALQGIAAFLVMFVVLYVVMRQLSDEDA